MSGPPFGGTPECPACPGELRNLAAVVHNFMRRREGDGHIKDYPDRVRRAVADCQDLLSSGRAVRVPPETTAFVAAADRWSRAYVAATERVEDWEALRAAYAAWHPLSEAHFADEVHSHGRLPGAK